MKHPLIGISTNLRPPEGTEKLQHSLPAAYVHSIQAAHGLPLLLPVDIDLITLRGLFDHIDGLLLTGGADLNPQTYQQDSHPAVMAALHAQDRSELALARWALDEHKPLLCICRGQQVLNVALGGNLIQHIPEMIENALKHTGAPGTYDESFHDVQIDPESQLARILKQTQFQVNSTHHQSVDTPGAGLRISARSADGVVEGIEYPDHPHAIAVQWHPERMLQQSNMLALFEGLVNACQ